MTDSAPTPLRLDASGGLLTIHSGDGAPLLGGCHAGVALSDGTYFSTENASSIDQVTLNGARLHTHGDLERPSLRWEVSLEDVGRALRLWLEVENTTGGPLPIERLDVLAAPEGFLRVPAGQFQVAQTGWNSWSPAYPPVPLSEQRPPAPPPVIGLMLPDTHPEGRVFPWVTLLRARAPQNLLLGFVTARDQQGTITIGTAPEGHSCFATSHMEGVSLPPGATVRSETLLLLFGESEPDAFQRYARTLAADMSARRWPHVPTGWCSWYYFFTKVTEEDVLRNLEYLGTEGHRMPLEYVQLDDGYQAHIGDWLTLNSKFPSGMPSLTAAIRSRGYKPGLWIAPFLVSELSEVYAQHPDWVLRDDNGQPINAMHNWETDNYALDTSHPEVAAWLRHVITTMVDDWGYDYLKIDFVYAAALRARRHDPSVTSVQAYRRGLEIIRQAAGERFILGCGAPFASSVGLVDGMRIGPDVSLSWDDPDNVYGSGPATFNAVRSTLAHSWMHRHLWVNDPDCLMVREHESSLTLPEVQAWTSVVAMTGGMVLVSDDLSRLEPDRAAFIPLVLPPLGEAAIPFGPSVDGAPTRLKLAVERPWESWLLASIFNWSDDEQPLTFDPQEWGIADFGEYHLFDLWTGEHFGPLSGPFTFAPTPPHGVRQLTVHRHLGRPQLVGSTLHLLGGAVEITGERWANNTLTLSLKCPGEHEGFLAIYVPEGYKYVRGDGDEPSQQGRLLTVPVRLRAPLTLALQFQGPSQ